LDKILDEIGGFGWMKNDILDSMFVQSLHKHSVRFRSEILIPNPNPLPNLPDTII